MLPQSAGQSPPTITALSKFGKAAIILKWYAWFSKGAGYPMRVTAPICAVNSRCLILLVFDRWVIHIAPQNGSRKIYSYIAVALHLGKATTLFPFEITPKVKKFLCSYALLQNVVYFFKTCTVFDRTDNWLHKTFEVSH